MSGKHKAEETASYRKRLNKIIASLQALAEDLMIAGRPVALEVSAASRSLIEAATRLDD